MTGVIHQEMEIQDCFAVLKAVSQEVCPTVVSMVYDLNEKTVYWVENRNWSSVSKAVF